MNAIEMNKVEFSYSKASTRTILNIPHWQVAQGEQIFIHGPSGSGKSTLLNLICGLQPVNCGTIKVLGEPISKMTSHQRDKYRAKNIGYIFQKFNLIDYLNTIDNIKLAMHFSPADKPSNSLKHLQELLTTLKLDQQDWHRPVHQLSVGQRQRVGIARALINQPQLIIADEPSSSLDQASRDSFISLLNALCQQQGATLLFVSHDMSLRQHFATNLALSEINLLESTQ
ncbi:ABC transporter ATP-binding protein [Colwellia psychrerythraea]|uniref:Phosphonate-transporting ATPase n=1 Tax=Colwellia psychrerythraea TaxID=28229 RepID=A0A099KH63_COLPS|nr:ABC transporter ATP-binding protein [Colwellia psychrerythraea]KGJ89590.1 Phosphonate-transporting ATPase [Colwellia psychrerythraea]